MSRASVDALPLIHPTFSAINLGLRDLSRVGIGIISLPLPRLKPASRRIFFLFQFYIQRAF
jgi:hypothetical protein